MDCRAQLGRVSLMQVEMTKRLEDLFYYDETSYSCLRRKTDWVSGKGGCTVRAKAGDATGSLSSTNVKYYDVYDGSRLVRAHVVIWKLLKGEIPDGYVVDHIDGNSLNNKIDNLRLVTDALNSRNQKQRETNKSGVNGVHLKCDNRDGKLYYRWIAQWNTLDSKRQQKSFSVNKYGFDEAFKMATEYRAKMIEELNLQGAGYTSDHGIRG